MSINFRRNFMKNWFAVEVGLIPPSLGQADDCQQAIPIWCIVATVVSGGTWFMARSAMGPTIQWTKTNPTPWNDIRPHQGTKLLQVQSKFDQRWVREKL
ncbi:hypothetical protein F5879DRAFT_990934 [Lentinula edodes]|uniref:Uncharacterized protein n=1 Tax=Lentinula lateritia TaxID=40482 RepID=A0A9W9AYW7_9AGAR|nr:uncharacterized protein C8R40DRAFT_1170120 [Lentinula edodes]KAH7875986.1 hypothetical protein C8R40DRAFT_1170120 [Lentinula edodes]KAJ3902532.1 hypothetical protein F5879DRAFT_990934 [Lentinula edodes]KAJ4492749.1 hypothetical protein C8J55DRAFT_555737 [Lentinula edodes]